MSTKKVKIPKNHKKSNKFDEKKIFLKKIFFDPFWVILVIFGIFWGSKIQKKIEKFFLTGIDPEWSEMHFKPKISIFLFQFWVILGYFGSFWDNFGGPKSKFFFAGINSGWSKAHLKSKISKK